MSTFLHHFYYKLRDSFAARVNYRLEYNQRAMNLTQSALTSTAPGVSNTKCSAREIIVSLTTHNRRLYDVYLAIESIMQGSIKPNRIILWLSEELKGEALPQTLQNQSKRGLEIRYTKDIGPYTKLIPTLCAFPKADIVTIDDDIIYMYDTLELLLNVHSKYPQCICANRILEPGFNKDGSLTSIITWDLMTDSTQVSSLNFFEGVGGVLYPAHCFSEEVFNQEVFLSTCPTADDIWFNSMALLNNTQTILANIHYKHLPLLINESVQDVALWRINNEPKIYPNQKQLHAVLNHYHLSFHR